MLDSAGYGPVTITKAITISGTAGSACRRHGAPPATASLSPPPLPTAVVLRGLTLVNVDVGQGQGIYALTAALVGVDRCAISGFGTGILYDATGVGTMAISDSELRANAKGIFATAAARLAGSRFRAHAIQNGPSNGVGIDIHDVFRTTISDSFIGDHGVGIFAVVTGLATSNISLSIDRTTIVDNVGVGLFAGHTSGPLAVVNLANSTAAGNDLGIVTNGGGYIRVTGTQINGNTTGLSGTGSIVTLGTNLLYGNGTNGTFTGSLSPN